MPILGPGSGITIADWAPEVCKKLEGKTTQITRAYEWMANALVELSGNPDLRDDFDELEVWGDPLTLSAPIGGVGTQEYPFSSFLNPDLEYNQSTLDVLMYLDPPSNTKRIKLHPSHYQDADRMTTGGFSQPSDWYRFGDNIGFNPTPDKAYTVLARCLKLYPINEQSLGETKILLTRQWKSVIVHAALIYGYIENQEFDKANAIKVMLYGDPKHPNDRGMIGAVHTRRMKESHRESVGLRPIIRTYTTKGGVR